MTGRDCGGMPLKRLRRAADLALATTLYTMAVWCAVGVLAAFLIVPRSSVAAWSVLLTLPVQLTITLYYASLHKRYLRSLAANAHPAGDDSGEHS